MANRNISKISDATLIRAWKTANSMMSKIPTTKKLSPQDFKTCTILLDEIEKMIHEFNRRGIKIPGQKRGKRKQSKRR
jgi:hypothetical protein